MRRLGIWIAYHAAVAALRDAYRARDLAVRARRALEAGLVLRQALRALSRELHVAPPRVTPPRPQWAPLVGTGLYPAPEGRA